MPAAGAKSRDVVVVVFDGVKLLDAAGPAEVFSEARAALDSGHTVGETARLAGFGSAETLRRVFVSQLGVSPKAYRDRFRTTRVESA